MKRKEKKEGRGRGKRAGSRPQGGVPSPTAQTTTSNTTAQHSSLQQQTQRPHASGHSPAPWRLALQDSVAFQSFIVGVNHSFVAPPPLAKPTLLQYYCTTIAQYTPPHQPPVACHTPYNIANGNIV